MSTVGNPRQINLTCETDALWRQIDLIRADVPRTSVERIRYVKNVYKCYEIIDVLYYKEHEYLHPLLVERLDKYQHLIIGDQYLQNISKKNCDVVKELYGNKCAVCDFPVTNLLEVHHIIPKNICGKNDIENLIALCPTCHVIFHDVEQKRCIKTELKKYLIENNLLTKVVEYTKHLVDENQSDNTVFSPNGCIKECCV